MSLFRIPNKWIIVIFWVKNCAFLSSNNVQDLTYFTDNFEKTHHIRDQHILSIDLETQETY
jgi:hypothetical protein